VIGRLLYRWRYFCADAWDEWRHSPAVNLLALATLTSALFLAGLVLLVVRNVEGRVVALRQDVGLEIYVTDDLADPERQALEQELRDLPLVARVTYVDKDEALRRYRRYAADMAALVNELGTNPLPASFEVALARDPGSSDAARAIARRLAGRPGVEEVRFNRELLERLEGLLALARRGGGAFAALVFLAVILVMASVLRLAVLARRDEIDIMQLVGATPTFIRGPFLVAGAAQGLLAAAAALVLVELGRRTGLAWAARDGMTSLAELICGQALSLASCGLVVLVGLAVSLAGSWFAVARE
jgi:cell division transport system permease protein